jgi:division protein CdvB (Snf7/Vps24/ESCRT-III family)
MASPGPRLRRAVHEISVAELVEILAITDLRQAQARAARDLGDIRRRLARIERIVTTEGTIMSEVNDRLDQLTTEVSGLADDVQTELAQLRDALTGSLTPDQAAKFDALDSKLTDMKTALETDDTAAPPAAPTA